MDAVQAAAEAATNGAEPVVEAGISITGKLTNVAANLGVGFIGVSITGVGATVAVQSFRAALKALKA